MKAKRSTVRGKLMAASLTGATQLVATLRTPIGRLQAVTLAMAGWRNGYAAGYFAGKQAALKRAYGPIPTRYAKQKRACSHLEGEDPDAVCSCADILAK